MASVSLTLRDNYWQSFKVQDSDLQFLYNHLLEIETPQTPQELLRALISDRIVREKNRLEDQRKAGGAVYLPKEHYQIGQTLTFPALGWKQGTVTGIREGYNPEIAPFEVLTAEFDDGPAKNFAAGLENHKLNEPASAIPEDPDLDANVVINTHGNTLLSCLNQSLEANPELVCIAGRWFPRALLVDVNAGHLNLAEAILDMANGGPLPTRALLEQIELPTDVNSKLTEFSFNLALQEDGRFDEVGPSGEVLWFLRRLEPEQVQNPPIQLRYNEIEYPKEKIEALLPTLLSSVNDELEPLGLKPESASEVSLSLIYPHWRAGTLPLTPQIRPFFPTAYESPRVQFTFVDGETGQTFAGWVVRAHKYAFGLREWYLEKGFIPGTLLRIRHGKKPGEVIIQSEKRRPTREWLRTVLVGADGGIVFALLKQQIYSPLDERMAISVPDSNALDAVWEQNTKRRTSLERTVVDMMRELAKLNTQGHVNAQELYAAVNILRRCPPGPILSLLTESSWASHIGDLYFRLNESPAEGRNDD